MGPAIHPLPAPCGTARRTEHDPLSLPGSTRQLTLGANKGFDVADFVADLRRACVTQHVAQKARYSAIDGRTTRHEGYALSIKHRKRIEETSCMNDLKLLMFIYFLFSDRWADRHRGKLDR